MKINKYLVLTLLLIALLALLFGYILIDSPVVLNSVHKYNFIARSVRRVYALDGDTIIQLRYYNLTTALGYSPNIADLYGDDL